MPVREIGASITADASQFKKEMSAVNSNLSGLQAEMKAVTAEFADNSKSTEALTAKQKILTQQEEQQKAKVDALKKALDEQTAATGENSVEADKLRKQWNNARADLAKTENQIKKNSEELKKATSFTEQLAAVSQKLKKPLDALQSAGAAAKKGLSLVADGAKATAAASAAAVAGAAAMTAALLKAVDDLATTGDDIDKMSQKLGMSAEAYQEWDAILQHSGASIDGMQAGMKTLVKAADDNSKAFKKLGLSKKDIEAMDQEELFASVISGLQGIEDETERTVLANELLGSSAKDLGPLLNTSAEETEAMRQRVHELGGVMSNEAVAASAKYKDSLQDLKTAFSGLKTGALQDFMPSVTKVIDGFTSALTGGDGAEQISEGIRELLSTALEGVGDNLDDALEVAESIISAILDALTEYAPELGEGAVKIITTLSQFLLENAPELLTSGIALITQLARGLSDSLPQLIPVAVQAVTDLVKTLAGNAPLLVKTGLELLLALVTGLVQAIPDLIRSVPEIISQLVDGFKEAWPEIKNIGKNIIDGILQGLKDAWDAVKSWFSRAVGGLHGTASVDVKTSGSHAAGLDYVPYDGYIAELHKGEQVLTAAEASAYRSGGPVGGKTVNINVTTSDLAESTIDYLIRRANAALGEEAS